MNRKRLACLLLAVAVVFAVGSWLDVPEGLRGYAQVAGGMTVDEVRLVMGRHEDRPDGRETTTGEFERSWSFHNGARYTVVFDKTGRVTYKEMGPTYCGVTPLMDKYADKK